MTFYQTVKIKSMKKDLFQIRRERLSGQIVEKIIQLIRNGDLKPGDKLPSEPELMKKFSVGRSSIREAIGAFSLIGLITVRPGQGTHVAVPSGENQTKPIGLMLAVGPEKVKEFVETRIELEKIIVCMTAQRATEEEIEKIKHHHNKLKAPLDSRSETIQADLDFHTAIAKACHNSVLARFLSELRLPMLDWMEQKAKFNWGYEKVYEQHDRILTAIQSRDGKKAQAAMQAHLESTSEKLVAAILERSPIDYHRLVKQQPSEI